MRIKRGVQLAGLQPEMILALLIVEPILNQYEQEVVITSATDSAHSNMSRHYVGYGLDLRSRNIARLRVDDAVREMQEALGEEFYIKFEVHHFHLQYNGSPRI